jgi:hypothetical protein
MGGEAAAELLECDPQYAAMSEHQRKICFKMTEKIGLASYLVSKSSLNKGVTDIAVPVGVQGTDTFAVLVVSHLAEANTRAFSLKIYS